MRLVKVTHGKDTTFTDPHGVDWQVYDPLATVGFYNPKDASPDTIIHLNKKQLPQISLPMLSQARTHPPTHRAARARARTHTHFIARSRAPAQDITLWCYLKCDGPKGNTWEKDVIRALKSWKLKGMVEQQGTSNRASPAHHSGRSAGGAARGPQPAGKNGRVQPASLAARLGGQGAQPSDFSGSRLDEESD